MSNPGPENSDGVDVPEEGLSEERFRDALARGDEFKIGKMLRLAGSLGPSTTEALANLFEGRAQYGEAFDALYEYRLVLVARKRGRPKNPSDRLLFDQEVAAFVNERISKKIPHKIVVHLAELKFGLKRSSVTKIVAASHSGKTSIDIGGT